MEIKKISKEILLSVLLYLLTIFVGLTITLAIGINLINNNQVVFGSIVIILGIILLVCLTIVFILNIIKLNRKLRKADKENILNNINLTENKDQFLSLNNERIIFYNDYLMFENEMINYESLDCYFALEIKKFFLYDDKILVIKFLNDEVDFSIKVDQDILKIIENKKINITNNLDYQYFIKNMDECLKKINKIISFNPNIREIPLAFAKNDEEKSQEKKIIRKSNTRSIIILIIMFILSMCFVAISTWLSENKNGVDFANKINLSLIIKIIFSVIVILCFFIKPKKHSIYARLSFIAFLLFYWAGIFFFDERLNLIIIHVFMYLFLIIGIKKLRIELKQIKDKKGINSSNRFICLGAFLALEVLYFTYNIGYSNDYIFLYSFLFCVFISLLAIPFILIKYNNMNKPNKKNLVGAMIVIPLCLITIGTASVSFEVMSINYMFDYSSGVEYIVQVKKLDSDDDYSDAKVYFEIDGIEYNVGISQEEFFDLEIGDFVKVRKYKGLFNLTYVIYDSKVM